MHFNSHAHVERDTYNASAAPAAGAFQLTRSRGAWPSAADLRRAQAYFNSHAHVERDFNRSWTFQGRFRISTHTLTWSVT